MPKVFTYEQRKENERKKINAKQDDIIRSALMRAKREKRLTYDDIAEISGLGRTTVQKIFNFEHSLGRMELDSLRRVCHALGIKLLFNIEEKKAV